MDAPAILLRREDIDMIKTLNALKRTLKPGVRFQILFHNRPECIGQIREVTHVQSNAFYSNVPEDPDNYINKAGDGKGFCLWYRTAKYWEFHDGVCTLFSNQTQHTEEYRIITLRLLGEEVS